MITPHKYLDLNLSVISLGALIITFLKNDGLMKYDELLEKITLARGENAKDVFVQTLGFLFLMGKIEYKKDIDSIEYIQ